MNRREIITTTAPALLTGVVGSLGGYYYGFGEGESEGYDEGMTRMCKRMGGGEPSTGDDLIRQVSKEVEIPSGEYERFGLTFSKETLLTYSVAADGYLDMLVMAKEDFPKYKSGEDPLYFPLLSSLDTTETVVRDIIQSRDLVLVLDNTKLGKATPADGSGEVTAAVELEAYAESESEHSWC